MIEIKFHLYSFRFRIFVDIIFFNFSKHFVRRTIAIGCFCIGTNQVDLSHAASKGIPVFNSPFSNSRSVVCFVSFFHFVFFSRIFRVVKFWFLIFLLAVQQQQTGGIDYFFGDWFVSINGRSQQPYAQRRMDESKNNDDFVFSFLCDFLLKLLLLWEKNL